MRFSLLLTIASWSTTTIAATVVSPARSLHKSKTWKDRMANRNNDPSFSTESDIIDDNRTAANNANEESYIVYICLYASVASCILAFAFCNLWPKIRGDRRVVATETPEEKKIRERLDQREKVMILFDTAGMVEEINFECDLKNLESKKNPSLSSGDDVNSDDDDIEPGSASTKSMNTNDTVNLEDSPSSDDSSVQTTTNPCCVICFEPYVVGDTIVRSNNPCCPHLYHRDCLADYFVQMRNKSNSKEMPCPFCRRSFCMQATEADGLADTGSSSSDGSVLSDYSGIRVLPPPAGNSEIDLEHQQRVISNVRSR